MELFSTRGWRSRPPRQTRSSSGGATEVDRLAPHLKDRDSDDDYDNATVHGNGNSYDDDDDGDDDEYDDNYSDHTSGLSSASSSPRLHDQRRDAAVVPHQSHQLHPLHDQHQPYRGHRHPRDDYSDHRRQHHQPHNPRPDQSRHDHPPHRRRGSDSSRAYGVSSPPKPEGRPRRYRAVRRFGPLHFYRVPNRTASCIGMVIILFVTVLILSLVRASQVENWKMVHGKVEKKLPPIHAWQSFRALKRYYGGLDTVIPRDRNVPEYPPREPAPASASDQARPAAAGQQAARDDGARPAGRGRSRPFEEHPESAHTLLRQKGAGAPAVECFVDRDNKVTVPPVRYYDGRPLGFPTHAVGSYEALGLVEDVCFERFGRYGPYGFGYSVRAGGLGTGQYGEKNGSEAVWADHPAVDYRGVDWADVQHRCYAANAHRFRPAPERPLEPGFFIRDPPPSYAGNFTADDGQGHDQTAASAASFSSGSSLEAATATPTGTAAAAAASTAAASTATSPTAASPTAASSTATPSPLSRTALVMRVWDEYNWREEDIMNMRALVVELSMSSGGMYDVHLLMQVKNDARYPVFADRAAYEERVRSSVPEEFRGLVTIWTQTQMLSLYQGLYDLEGPVPDNPVHGPYRGLSMALQYFAYLHPEYDHFWQWEMDARYVGHYLDLVQKLENWARAQPRKGLWERNERFYVPGVHGSWDEFRQMAKIQAEMGMAAPAHGFGRGGAGSGPAGPDTPSPLIWGPVRPANLEDHFRPERDPTPPTASPDGDAYSWGVGEEADLISLYPIFEPVGTTWYNYRDITGYKTDTLAIPRRAHIIVVSRVSRRLLMTMHRETAYKKHFAFPEMWQASVALHHGYKAVAAPHPMYVEREWPIKYLAQTLNNGKNGASGGARTSVFGSREHNLQTLSWFYRSTFAGQFYRRWLGLRVDDVGGEQFETDQDLSKGDKNVEDLRGGEGRMCIPSMLIHPAKEIELPVERVPEGEADAQKAAAAAASDPTA